MIFNYGMKKIKKIRMLFDVQLETSEKQSQRPLDQGPGTLLCTCGGAGDA